MFFLENVYISMKFPLMFIAMCPFNNIPALVSDNGLAPAKRQAIM